MVELLARHSKLKVEEAEHNMEVKRNQVYLIPNDKFMTISNNRLQLTEKKTAKGPHLTINTLFTSLAADAGPKAIGIILSGLGSDGTEGVSSIKTAGGMVLVRNPETTEYSSMPSYAIATGMVDFILEPEFMPGVIEDYVKHQGDVKYKGELIADDKSDEKYITAIIALIKEKSPLDFSDYKQTTILRRTKRRAAHKNFIRLSDYLEFLKSTPEEVEALAKNFLISVTAFFRDKEAFDVIKDTVFPDLLSRITPDEELKIWVAGCATGEEVYSLAILITEQLNANSQNNVVKIFATDIDNAALAYAGKGIYPKAAIKNIPREQVNNFFIKEGNNYRVKPEIRKMVIFAQHDLVKNPPYCNMHFISCRNLLIYMTPILQKKIFTLLLFGLKMDGYLFLGTSESPMPIMNNLEVVDKKWKIYKNIKAKQAVTFDAFSMPDLQGVRHAAPLSSLDESSKNTTQTVADAMLANLANEQDHLTVCIDEHNQVIKSYGDPTKYLLQKYFTSNLPDLLPKPLAVAFNILSNNTLKTNKGGHINGIKIKNSTHAIKVKISVSPLEQKKGEKKLLMVTFREDKLTTDKPLPEDTLFDEQLSLNQYSINLEEEVKELKDKLQLSYESLKASNENMQSFNEELISANEEMQSTNEEMQSVNEELHTINSDYQLKNKELVEINDDLNNYFRSNINGQLFINNDLVLMKFSPGAVKQINLLETDIGRPLSNISTNIKFDTIINDIKQVLATGTTLTKEVETNNNHWYQMMIMPYIRANHKNNGAVITFNDITELKNTQNALDKKNKSLLRINADLDHFIHATSHDLLAPLGNIEASINELNSMTLSESDVTDFLNIINLSIKQFRELVTEIATIAKIESDMLVLELVDLDEIINSVTWSLQNQIKTTGAIINRDIKEKKILFSKKNLRSIIYNLISNAIKYKRDLPPVINIDTVKDGENVIITVQDNGTGIAKEKLHKVFEIYTRFNQDTEGNGIGLYLAKKIIDAAGGHIIVESEPGVGSKFIIHLMAKASDV